VIIEKV